MKNYVIATMLMVGLMLFSSCKKDDSPKKEPDIKTDGKVEMLSYGFYKEDNKNLNKDYIAEISDEMVIRLPKKVDKSALVARFTVTEDDEVLVGKIKQESGKTQNDFNYPIDYIVKDVKCNKSKVYTVKVEDMLEKTWKEAAVYNDGENSVSNAVMCINPKNGNPYFFVLRSLTIGEESIRDAGAVGSYNNGQISLGENITLDVDNKTVIRGQYPAIASDKDGKIYVAYYTYKYISETKTKDFKVIVRNSNGSMLAEPFCKTRCGENTRLVVDPESGHFICATYANSDFAPIKRRGLNLSYNKAGQWESENTIADFGDNEVHKTSTCIANGQVYMGGQLAGRGKTHSYFIYRYNNGNWNKVINILPEGMSGAAQLLPAPIAVSSDGTAYMLAGNDSKTNGEWFITLMKANPKENKWENVGSSIMDNSSNKATNRHSEFDFALIDDVPVVVYLNQDDTNHYAQVVTFNEETKDWNEPVKLSDLPVERGTLHMVSGIDGTGYISFVDCAKGDNVINSLHLYQLK